MANYQWDYQSRKTRKILKMLHILLLMYFTILFVTEFLRDHVYIGVISFFASVSIAYILYKSKEKIQVHLCLTDCSMAHWISTDNKEVRLEKSGIFEKLGMAIAFNRKIEIEWKTVKAASIVSEDRVFKVELKDGSTEILQLGNFKNSKEHKEIKEAIRTFLEKHI